MTRSRCSSRAHVGRLAFTFHDRVDIEPISHVYSEGWVYARTSPGTKLTTVKHHPWVAFEVDEVQQSLRLAERRRARNDLLSRSESKPRRPCDLRYSLCNC